MTTDPPGARVMVDGVSHGSTPTTVALPPGQYAVTLTLPGHHDAVHHVVLERDDPEPLVVNLRPTSDPDPDRQPESASGRSRGAWIGASAATAAAGIVTAVIGGIVLGREGCELSGCGRDPARPGVTPYRETTLEGALLLATGAALTIAGTAVLIRGLRLDASLSPSSARLRMTWSF